MAAASGKYYSDVKQGNCFIGCTAAAGTAFPVSTSTAMTFGVWNVTSTKNVVLMYLNVGHTSGTTGVGSTSLTIVHGGFGLGTPISAFTDGVFGSTIRNALFGASGGPAARFTPSGATIVAGTAGYYLGIGQAAASPTSMAGAHHDFDGAIILGPGQAAFVTNSVAQAGLWSMSIGWQEVPV
jgi:hypothetical protein